VALYSSVEVKVGFFVGLCAALFVAMLVTYSKVAPVWRGRQEINVVFADVSSLRPDAPVRYNGVEVGRVKWVRMVHLDKKNMDRLPKLARNDLDNLPLRSEAVKKELREAREDDFDGKCRRELKDRTMIELCLEVLQEGDVKRYRLDDKIRIVSTVFGDAAVEIISGSGTVNTSNSGNLVLGVSGDFFSNLAKSMGDVKEILSNVTEVVGTQERRSFERATARFTRISDRADKIGDFADKRAEVTSNKMDTLSTDINKTMTKASDSLEKIEPQARKTFDNIRGRFNNAQDRISDADREITSMTVEFTNDAKTLRADITFTMEQSRPNFEAMKKNIRAVYDDFGGLSSRLDRMRDIAGRVVSQSEPDLERMRSAMSNSLVNLKRTGQAAMENKDLMISNKDLGEYEYNTAVDISRKLAAATRRIREAGAEVDESARAVSAISFKVEAGAPLLANPITPLLTRTSRVLDQMYAMRTPLEDVYHLAETKMLPEFERKRTSWRDELPAK
jgi:hypothetical protein